jgi:hypothetical protein
MVGRQRDLSGIIGKLKEPPMPADSVRGGVPDPRDLLYGGKCLRYSNR